MITGDNPLTACAVARDVAIVERDVLIMDKDEGDTDENRVILHSIDDSIYMEINPNEPLDTALLNKYDFCLAGAAMSLFMNKPNMDVLLEHTWVYARVSPSQKVKFNERKKNR